MDKEREDYYPELLKYLTAKEIEALTPNNRTEREREIAEFQRECKRNLEILSNLKQKLVQVKKKKKALGKGDRKTRREITVMEGQLRNLTEEAERVRKSAEIRLENRKLEKEKRELEEQNRELELENRKLAAGIVLKFKINFFNIFSKFEYFKFM